MVARNKGMFYMLKMRDLVPIGCVAVVAITALLPLCSSYFSLYNNQGEFYMETPETEQNHDTAEGDCVSGLGLRVTASTEHTFTDKGAKT